MEACKKAGFDVVSLVHEYPIGFSTEQIQAHLEASDTVIFPCGDVRRSYEEHPDNAMLMKESTPSLVVLPQGCYMLEKPQLESGGDRMPAGEAAGGMRIKPERSRCLLLRDHRLAQRIRLARLAYHCV